MRPSEHSLPSDYFLGLRLILLGLIECSATEPQNQSGDYGFQANQLQEPELITARSPASLSRSHGDDEVTPIRRHFHVMVE